jgi:excisionase family DNA binding protein
MARRPLYVRLPEDEAERLDRAAFERKVSKQDLITDLLARHLDGTGPGQPLELPAEGLAVGRHAFRPATAEVLTLPEAAELLRVDEAAVVALAESGELPGRKVAGEWRFARAAVLQWLARA